MEMSTVVYFYSSYVLGGNLTQMVLVGLFPILAASTWVRPDLWTIFYWSWETNFFLNPCPTAQKIMKRDTKGARVLIFTRAHHHGPVDRGASLVLLLGKVMTCVFSRIISIYCCFLSFRLVSCITCWHEALFLMFWPIFGFYFYNVVRMEIPLSYLHLTINAKKIQLCR